MSISGFWTTSGTPSGDQQASYSQADFADAYRILSACAGFEGVAPGFLNELACTAAGAETVAVNTGGAMVDGKWFLNDASQNVTVAAAVGSGNTRIDRIVLRANWAGFNVSVHRIAGTDAATPTAPAITQTSETTYDIMLCQALVDTSGNITITDEREWAVPSVDDSTIEVVQASGALGVKDLGIDTAKIKDANVTEAKIGTGAVTNTKIGSGAVNYLKIGDRVPKLLNRQGGNAADWSVAGTNNYATGNVAMFCGVKMLTIDNGFTSGNVTITFPVSFSYAPVVTATKTVIGLGGVVYALEISNVSSTEVTIQARRDGTSGSDSFAINWMALGPA